MLRRLPLRYVALSATSEYGVESAFNVAGAEFQALLSNGRSKDDERLHLRVRAREGSNKTGVLRSAPRSVPRQRFALN